MPTDAEKLEKRRQSNRESYQRHKEARLEKRRQWRLDNPERMKELNRQWYAEHREYAQEKRKVYRVANQEKIRGLMRRWYLANRTKQLAASRLQYTGCTPELYQELLLKQDGLCAICNRPPRKYALGADHCHSTNVVRGLLCHQCNTILGLAKDNIDTLLAAVEYLKQHRLTRTG